MALTLCGFQAGGSGRFPQRGTGGGRYYRSDLAGLPVRWSPPESRPANEAPGSLPFLLWAAGNRRCTMPPYEWGCHTVQQGGRTGQTGMFAHGVYQFVVFQARQREPVRRLAGVCFEVMRAGSRRRMQRNAWGWSTEPWCRNGARAENSLR